MKTLRQPPLLLAWLGFLLLAPVYLFPSGTPQVGDYLMVPFLLVLFLKYGFRISRGALKPVTWLAAFTTYAATVGMVWALLLGEISLSPSKSTVMAPIFYLYNTLVFVSFFVLYRQYGMRLLRITLYGVIAAVTAQTFVGTLLFRAGLLRQAVSFNNPNQLGFYALLSATIIVVGARQLKVRRGAEILGYACCIYLAMLSASKAAFVGVGLLAIIAFSTRPLVTVISGLLLVGALNLGGAADSLFANVETRFTDIGKGHDDNLESRGYLRIVEYPEHWVLGAGEGALQRFDTRIEIHSSLGTIFFSYGIIGTLLMLLFGGHLLLCTGPISFLYLGPILFYSLTHNCLRFTLFWVALAFVLGVALEKRSARRLKNSSSGLEGSIPLPLSAP